MIAKQDQRLSRIHAVGIQPEKRRVAKDAERRRELPLGTQTPNEVLSVVVSTLRNSALSASLRFSRPGSSASSRLKIITPFFVIATLAAVIALNLGCSLFAQTNIAPLNAWQTTRTNPAFFPIAVWLQAPSNAPAYRAAGINTFVGLWAGPTDAQLSELNKAGMLVVCDQNQIALNHPARSNILAWMHRDEPDNATTWGARLGFSKPVPVESVAAEYCRMKSADAMRPVLLNLGQGVAWDNWYGRGSRNHHPEDYPRYLEACDIASFDIYPATHTSVEIAGNLWYVPLGVERLRRWTHDEKPVWNCIETTRGDDPRFKPTSHEVRAEVWMSLIHGSRGIIYFAHQFKPTFIEAALLADSQMLFAVTTINRQITELAPVLNSPTKTNIVSVNNSNPAAPVATMVKEYNGYIYIFAVAMRPLDTQVEFALNAKSENLTETKVEVLGEYRGVIMKDGKFTDRFAPWDVHLYRVKSSGNHPWLP